MCVPLPLIISPMVRTLRYFLHLLRFMRSRLGSRPLRNISIRNLSLLVDFVRCGVWSCSCMLCSLTNCHRCLSHELVVRKCVSEYGLENRFPGSPSSSFRFSSERRSILPRMEEEVMDVIYFMSLRIPCVRYMHGMLRPRLAVVPCRSVRGSLLHMPAAGSPIL